MTTVRSHPGIRVRHRQDCRQRTDGRCNCDPAYEAWVFDRRSGAKVRKTFPSLAEAKGWRTDTLAQARRGGLNRSTRRTVRESGEAWLEGAKGRAVLTRSGNPYKPSALRSYESDLRRHVYPELGGTRLTDLERRDVQALVDQLVGQGFSGSKVRNALVPLRAVCRHAIERDELHVNPTSNLRLPAPAEPRDRIATPAEAAALLEALPADERALWATAFYGGLRRGELRALACGDVDLKGAVIRVHRSWDDVEGYVDPKSKKGTREVPIPGVLRKYLAEHLARTGRRGSDLVFGKRSATPFTSNTVRRHAAKAWAEHEPPLAAIGLHEARHTYVSLMHEAGVPLETIGDFVGHSSTWMTDRYRHLLPETRNRAAAKLDAYLAASR
ncbi:MAG TPA: tyrosine-type recombinase/integrase [Gaiellaceae bacterium]|nr:tyrosine-type recombinase/integrase [Gaiellaceae bacterium]